MTKLIELLPNEDSPWRLTHLMIISPYISREFFCEIAKRYSPLKILLIVDDSCRTKEAETAISVLKADKKTKTIIYYASGTGLVHLKFYYFIFKSSSKTKHYIVWGSANATVDGFFKNSELLSSTHLYKNKDGKLIGYLESIWNMTRVGSFHLESFNGGVESLSTIFLPSLRCSNNNIQDTFDSWVQAGWLLHKYEPTNNFLKFEIPLKKPIDPSEIAVKFAKYNLTTEGEKNKLWYSYIERYQNNKRRQEHWKSVYFLETYLGHWCSKDCYIENSMKFVANNQDKREKAVEELKKKAQQGDQNKYIEAAIKSLNKVRKTLGGNATRYFLDSEFYWGKAENQLKRDIKRANYPFFKEKFVSGYDRQPLPRFRSDEISWEAFLEDFCNALLCEVQKKGGNSKLGKLIKNNYPHLINYEAKDLLKEFRENWHKYRERFNTYHLSDDWLINILQNLMKPQLKKFPHQYGPWSIDNDGPDELLIYPNEKYFDDSNGFYFGIEGVTDQKIRFYFFCASYENQKNMIMKKLKTNKLLIKKLNGSLGGPDNRYLFIREINRPCLNGPTDTKINEWAGILKSIINELSPYLIKVTK